MVEKKKAKKGKKKELTKIEETKPKSYEKQTKVLVLIMVVLIVSVVCSHWLIQRDKKFTYKGFEFQKTPEGHLIFYQSIIGHTVAGGQESTWLLKLRIDPRTVDYIPIEGSLEVMKDVIFSYSPEIMQCPNTYRTNFDLSWTLAGVGVRNITVATNNRSHAKAEEIAYATCKDANKKTVILMIESNETKITREGDCFTVEISNCEIQEAFTKFIVEFLAQNLG